MEMVLQRWQRSQIFRRSTPGGAHASAIRFLHKRQYGKLVTIGKLKNDASCLVPSCGFPGWPPFFFPCIGTMRIGLGLEKLHKHFMQQ